jgi:DNA polymerase-1
MIRATTSDAYRLMHYGALAFARAERQGIRVDMDYVNSKMQELDEKIHSLKSELKSTNFWKHWVHRLRGKEPNINSNPQLAHYLYNVKKYTPAKTTESGKGSTDEEALKALNVPELNIILQIRKLDKIKGTYLEPFKREAVKGYIHPTFNLHTVRTFRSSSDKPNFQNIPKRDKEAMQTTRKALYPRPGHQLIEVDYSGLEFNINACYSEDPEMIKYCKDPKSDPHGDLAKKIYMIDDFDKSIPGHSVLRSATKNGFVFPELYGSWYKACAQGLASDWGGLPTKGKWRKGKGIEVEEGRKLSDHLIEKGIKSFDEFTEHVKDVEDEFFNMFPTHKEYMESTYENYVKNGYVDMKTGFRCKGLMSKNNVLNYPIQGSAFHCLLWSFIELDRLMIQENWDTRLIGQIHDAIIFDVHPDELDYILKTIKYVTCKQLPETWPWIVVPLDVDAELAPVDGSWADKKDYPI